MIFVPPPALILWTMLLNPFIFYPVTHFNPQSLCAELLNVIILSLSEGVNVYNKNLIVYLTNWIFYPPIEPLLSITQIRSTLVLLPPLDLRLTMAGSYVGVLSLIKDL